MSVAVPLWVPSALAGILLIALAGALLVLDRRQLATRAFAVLLVLRALGTIARAFQTSPSFTIDAAASLVFPATAACSAFGGLYFVLVYPRRRTWIGRSPYGWVALAIPAAALAIFILARPDLYAILAPDPAGGARLVSAGPLFGFLPLAFITTCAFALVFAWEYARAPRTSGRSVLLLVSLAFALEAVVTSLMYVVADVAGTLRPVPGVYGRLQAIDFEIGFLPLLLLVAVLLRARAQDGDTRREVPLALAALGLAALSAVATVVVTGSLDLTAPQPQHRGYLIGMWRLAFPLLVAYALLQHRLFDIDLKIKWTIKRGTLAAIFIAVFFVAAQVAQNLFSESYGVWIGGVAAGLLLFAVAPLQRMAEKVANVAMPGVQDTPQWRDARREDSFRFAVRMALADGVVTRDEDRGLASLAADLGLDARRAFELREQVERDLAGQPVGA